MIKKNLVFFTSDFKFLNEKHTFYHSFGNHPTYLIQSLNAILYNGGILI